MSKLFKAIRMSLLGIAAAGMMAMAVPSDAHAACVVNLKLTRSFAGGTAGTNWSWFYGVPITASGFAPVAYFFRVPEDDQALTAQLHAALAGQRTVQVGGNVASCPGSGTYRDLGFADFAWVLGLA